MTAVRGIGWRSLADSAESCAGWVLMACFLFPLIWMAGYAAVSSCGGVGVLSAGWTLDHWERVLSGGRIWRSLLLSSGVAVTATGLGWLLAAGLVCGLRPLREDLRMQSLWHVPLSIPPVAAGFLASLWLSRSGLISRIAWLLGLSSGIDDFPVLVQDRLGIGLLFTLTCGTLPLLTLYLLRIWRTAGVDHYVSAACALGASRGYALRKIALAMLWRRSGPLLLMVFLWNFSAWEVPLLLGRNSSPMLSVLIQRSSGQFVLEERPQAFGYAVMYLVVSGTAVWLISGERGLSAVRSARESGDV